MFLDACRDRKVRFVVGHRLSAEIAQILVTTPKRRWQPAVTADGTGLREHATVVEITDQVDLTGWPEGTRMIARREPCHPGAQLTFTDIDGHRYQVMITDLRDADVAYLEALYRGRGRVEQRIGDAKDTGLANLPSASFAINQAWLNLVLTAQDLLRWTQLRTLDGELARVEPKRLRYTLLHTAGLIVTNGRQKRLRLSNDWPWTTELIAAFTRLHQVPLRT